MIGKELLLKIQKVTQEIMFGSQVENFKSGKMKDSDVEVKYSSLEVGVDVFLSSPEGDVVADNGEYILDNGDSFKVEEGKISEVITAEEVVEEEVKEELAEEETATEVVTDNQEELKTKIAELEAELASLKDALKEQSEGKAEEFSKLQSDVKPLAELLSAIAKVPAEFSKVETRNEAEDMKNEKLNNLASIISKK